jgi:hypothetical protein
MAETCLCALPGTDVSSGNETGMVKPFDGVPARM